MAFVDSKGGKHTNHSSMRQANASHMAKMPMGKPEPATGEPQEGMEGADPNDRPMMTEHHADGSHTTTHESGKQVHHASAEELVEHLKKHMPEEEQEIAEGDGEEEPY